MKLAPIHHRAILVGLMSPDVQIDAEDAFALIQTLVVFGFEVRLGQRPLTSVERTMGGAFCDLMVVQDLLLTVATFQAATRYYKIRLNKFPHSKFSAVERMMARNVPPSGQYDPDLFYQYFPNIRQQSSKAKKRGDR